MNWMYTWLPLMVVFLVLYLQRKRRRKLTAQRLRKRNRTQKGRICMQELAMRFIGKDSILTLMEGTADGVVREVRDGGVLLEKDGQLQLVNLDYVVKIREYPYKNGKRATFVGS